VSIQVRDVTMSNEEIQGQRIVPLSTPQVNLVDTGLGRQKRARGGAELGRAQSSNESRLEFYL